MVSKEKVLKLRFYLKSKSNCMSIFLLKFNFYIVTKTSTFTISFCKFDIYDNFGTCGTLTIKPVPVQIIQGLCTLISNNWQFRDRDFFFDNHTRFSQNYSLKSRINKNSNSIKWMINKQNCGYCSSTRIGSWDIPEGLILVCFQVSLLKHFGIYRQKEMKLK